MIAGWRAGDPVQRGLSGTEDAGAWRVSLPACAVADNRIVRLLAFELSKWSMADVMVLAIFMSFVAFNGVIGSAWDGLRRDAECPAGDDPDECFEDSARLLPVCWFLPVEHLALEEAGTRDRFDFRL